MSSDTTTVQSIPINFVAPTAEQSVQPVVEPAVRTEQAGLDDRWIETQLARERRWRRPSWPLLCEVAERRLAQQRRPSMPPIELNAIPATQESNASFWSRVSRAKRVWIWSLILYGAFVVALGLWTCPTESGIQRDVLWIDRTEHQIEVVGGPPRLLVISAAEADIDPITATDPADCPVPPPPEVSLATFVEDATGPVLDVQALMNDRDDAVTRGGDTHPGTEFFGVRATGQRFVFLIDCSVTMSVGTKWIEAMRQLTAAVESLGEDQWFYVVFFSEESQRMFDIHAPEPHCLPATPENVQRLRRWLLTIETGMSTQPAKSVKFALTLDPDAIFMLSDGEYDQHDPTLELLGRERSIREADGKPQVVVHTLSFFNGNLSPRDKKKLQEIARQNGGRYACVAPGRPRAVIAAD